MINNEDGTYIYFIVPERFHCTYTKLLKKMSELGVSIINDCTSTCKGERRQIINSWYMFQSACAAYNLGETKKADFLIKYINDSFNFNCNIIGEIIIGNYTGEPTKFNTMNYDDIITNSNIENIYLVDKVGKFIFKQTSDIHFMIVPNNITITLAMFGNEIATTLYEDKTKTGAYRINTNLKDGYTVYWFYSPIGKIEEDIIVNYNSNL